MFLLQNTSGTIHMHLLFQRTHFTPYRQLATDAPDTPHEEQCMPSHAIPIFKSYAVYYVKRTDYSVYIHLNGRWPMAERRSINDSFQFAETTCGSFNANLPIQDTNNEVVKWTNCKNKPCNTLWRSKKQVSRVDNNT